MLRPPFVQNREPMTDQPPKRTFKPSFKPFEGQPDTSDPAQIYEYREHVAREKMVEMQRIAILRERVKACYEREGVNHIQLCRKQVKEYLQAIKPYNGMDYE